MFFFTLAPYKYLDAKTISNQLDAMSADVRDVMSTFSKPPRTVVQEFTDKIRDLQKNLLIICDNAMKDQHWEEVFRVSFLH